MPDETQKKFSISIGQKVRSFIEGHKAIPLGEVSLIREPNASADASFWEWITSTWREMEGKPGDPPLCAGARIVVDENGDGILTIDESLPDGVWLVTRGGKTMRYEGVFGPVRVESHAEDQAGIERNPVALTFETRK
jgi:hypothetical protein